MPGGKGQRMPTTNWSTFSTATGGREKWFPRKRWERLVLLKCFLQYSELEDKIPGLKDGMFKSPTDGEWKKVRDDDYDDENVFTGMVTMMKKVRIF